ncbi:acyl-CoA carboxylase subunit epsilon [Mycolicibacterium thermoresistibile]
MSQDTDITEVSDPRQLTIDNPPDTSTTEIQVLKGQPTDDELAALVAVISAAAGHTPDPGPQELNMWGHPVDKLRYHIASWQRVTLLERTHMRR